MNNNKCIKCNKTFKLKSDYVRHINKKFSCIKNSPDLTNFNQKLTEIDRNLPNKENLHDIEKFVCNYCSKTFCNKYTLERHLNDRCKIKKEDINTKEEIYQILLKQMKEMEENNKKQIQLIENNQKQLLEENEKQRIQINELKKEIAKKNKTSTNSINNGTINNIDKQQNINTNNQQNNIKQLNINLIAHGKEDLSFITDDQMKKILNKGFKSIENLTQIVHFDKNRPENHNIYISNIKDSYVMMYDGNDWKLMNRENCLQDMYDDKCDYLVEKFEQLEGKLDESTLKRFGNFLSRKDDDKIIEQTKREIKLILYNNRKIPEETRRLLKLNDECMLEQ